MGNWNFQGRGNGGFSPAPYHNGYNGGNYNQGYSGNGGGQRPQKKRSGARSGFYTPRIGPRAGKQCPYVSGWKATSQGLIKVFCAAYKKSKEVTSKTSGRVWRTWVAKVTPQNGVPYVLPCMFDVARNRVIIEGLQWVVNPGAPNGGYCGRYWRKKN